MEIHRLDQASRRLLLLSARGDWNDAQRARALQLAAAVSDWNAFCDVAIRSFGACLAYRLLSTLDAGSVPPAILERMQQVSRMVAVRSLQIEGAMLDFTSGCLEPLGVRHAFFKGASLAHRYHSAPAARPSRDVDVLVDQAMAFAVVRHARQAGYTPVRPIGPGDRDLARWMKQETVYGMHSPNGVLIEIHHSLDHGDGVLDSHKMLGRAERIEFRGRSLPVLRTADLFVYMCMHHTRHFWSHLHWYADLDAITAHPLFDLAEVRELAAGVRLGSTIEACLQLHEFARSADWPESLSLERWRKRGAADPLRRMPGRRTGARGQAARHAVVARPRVRVAVVVVGARRAVCAASPQAAGQAVPQDHDWHRAPDASQIEGWCLSARGLGWEWRRSSLMGAIFGVLARDRAAAESMCIAALEHALAHRGSDVSGCWSGEGASLGIRLFHTTPESLLETPPKVAGGRGLVIACDCRIDNREELYRSLGDLVEVPCADSALVLAAYERWGGDCVDHLIGDFAFAIFDPGKHELFCARDHFGAKPFCYTRQDGLFRVRLRGEGAGVRRPCARRSGRGTHRRLPADATG
ncbi:nucleotidyltransferase family protein [Thermomonas sp.]|uniref:nucleotidyltransferase family protein n=1 Tax=Thermomonas sp. TaxID=1971895 RepID=UPI00261D4ACF|nr:nucleotidyltransferase family protein [Thermomonas sp.]MBL0227558.1 nucleotidyltransferase family protein [Thermomonas sp.]